MIDTYKTFADLAARVTEGNDFRIVTRKMNTPYLIVAIHGGNIEPFTSEIADGIAGEDHAFYSFEGVRPERNSELHIGSEYFDESSAMDMVRNADVIVSIHGQRDTENEFVMLGGLCEGLKELIKKKLQEVDIAIWPIDLRVRPNSTENICNRGMSGGGVELEISRKLRDALREDAGLHRLFVRAVRDAIAAYRGS